VEYWKNPKEDTIDGIPIASNSPIFHDSNTPSANQNHLNFIKQQISNFLAAPSYLNGHFFKLI
jgi:hypothetical protein